MKVNKIHFNECIEYLSEINSYDINELDLSEFTNEDLSTYFEIMQFSGLSNKDIIKNIRSKNNEIH